MSLNEFSIFRGHIPDQAVQTISSAPVPPAAIMGVLAAASLTIGLVAATLWATVWLAITLI
ncbi:MAG TPA: hypothetical protein VKR55_11745 [Bradyrhizobium sp.]|uniref:hypothetical protein n=1 Tax=Bradyrhizobium sp. TaxID=376 RepID=UPI002BBAD308|nr:hypothetical protein [Bradyrhizobium sp.]HLZ02811.1 hypothetical protein [Bradyrhizobium sp.]